MHRPLVALCCALLLVLAGCGSPTTEEPPTSDVRLTLDNSDDVTHEITVSVVPSTIETLRITDANGTTTTYRNVSGLDTVPPEVLGSAVGYTATGPGVTTKSYVLEPQTGIGDALTDTPQNASILFLITIPEGDEPTRSWGSVTCGSTAFTVVEIDIASGGAISVSNQCGSATTGQ